MCAFNFHKASSNSDSFSSSQPKNRKSESRHDGSESVDEKPITKRQRISMKLDTTTSNVDCKCNCRRVRVRDMSWGDWISGIRESNRRRKIGTFASVYGEVLGYDDGLRMISSTARYADCNEDSLMSDAASPVSVVGKEAKEEVVVGELDINYFLEDDKVSSNSDSLEKSIDKRPKISIKFDGSNVDWKEPETGSKKRCMCNCRRVGGIGTFETAYELVMVYDEAHWNMLSSAKGKMSSVCGMEVVKCRYDDFDGDSLMSDAASPVNVGELNINELLEDEMFNVDELLGAIDAGPVIDNYVFENNPLQDAYTGYVVSADDCSAVDEGDGLDMKICGMVVNELKFVGDGDSLTIEADSPVTVVEKAELEINDLLQEYFSEDEMFNVDELLGAIDAGAVNRVSVPEDKSQGQVDNGQIQLESLQNLMYEIPFPDARQFVSSNLMEEEEEEDNGLAVDEHHDYLELADLDCDM